MALSMARFAGARSRAVPALFGVVGMLACSAPAAVASVSISSFTVTPSTTQAGAAPDVELHAQLSSPDGDTPSAVTVSLAPGLLADPNAPTVCSSADYANQNCPASSQIGHGTITGYSPAFGTSVSLATQMYLIQPQASAIAEIGLIADFYDYPAANVQAPVSIRTTPTVGIDIPMTGIPKVFDDNGTQIPIQVQDIDLTLSGTVNGKPFTRNPTSCAAATTTFTLESYGDPSSPVSAQGGYTPSACSALGYAPALTASSVIDTGDDGVSFDSIITQRASDSATSTVSMSVPSGLSIRGSALGAACQPSALASCAPIGTATAGTPLLSQPVTGSLYLVSSGTGLPSIDAVFPSPLGLSLQGSPSLTSSGLAATFNGLPDVPLTSLEVDFTGGGNSLFTAGSDICSPGQSVTGTFGAQSGASATVTAPLSVSGPCPATSGTGAGNGTGTASPAPGSGAGAGKGGVHITGARPTAIAHATGLTSKHPVLSVSVTAGANAPGLRRFSIGLPAGFTVNHHAFARGVSGTAGSSSLARSAFSPAGGVSVALGAGARTATVQLGAPSLRLARDLLIRLRHHRAVTLHFIVTVHDVDGRQTRVPVTVKLQ